MKKFLPNKVLVQINFYIDRDFIPDMSRNSTQYIYEFENGIKGIRYKGNFVEVNQESGSWISNIYARKSELLTVEDLIEKIFGDERI